jgi:hypothetical protein
LLACPLGARPGRNDIRNEVSVKVEAASSRFFVQKKSTFLLASLAGATHPSRTCQPLTNQNFAL